MSWTVSLKAKSVRSIPCGQKQMINYRHCCCFSDALPTNERMCWTISAEALGFAAFRALSDISANFLSSPTQLRSKNDVIIQLMTKLHLAWFLPSNYTITKFIRRTKARNSEPYYSCLVRTINIEHIFNLAVYLTSVTAVVVWSILHRMTNGFLSLSILPKA